MSIEEIRKAFGGRLIGSRFIKDIVCLAVSRLPNKTIKHITKNVWFLSSEDTYGYAFDGNDLAGKHMIFLADILFEQSKEQILYTILHEIGHVVLKHKNSIGVKQTKKEVDKQEKEADQFVNKYLTNS